MVLYEPEIEFDLTIDEVAAYVVRTDIVKMKDISIAVLPRSPI